MKKGFSLLESLFAFSILSIVIVMIYQSIIIVYKNKIETQKNYRLQIESIEEKLHSLFLPVEDLEWALNLVLY